MGYAILEFLLQLSVLYLLVAMFILIDLLLWTMRARKFREAKQQRMAEHFRGAESHERRRIGERPATTGRSSQATASLLEMSIRRKEYIPGIRRRTVFSA